MIDHTPGDKIDDRFRTSTVNFNFNLNCYPITRLFVIFVILRNQSETKIDRCVK